jgi:hypothetical protein
MIRQRRPITAAIAVLFAMAAAFAPSPGSAATRARTLTLVFDVAGRTSFMDQPPAGPSPGDTEFFTGRVRDAASRFVGTVRTTCVFTKMIPNDVLERCSASGRTSDGTLSFGGVGHLESMNPPWPVTGGTGAYKGVHGSLVFEADIRVDPNVPLAAGRLFTVAVFKLATHHQLHAGVVTRPAANAPFIRHATAACGATNRQAMTLPGFPFSTFDPFHPDPQLLPQVGRYFDQPARRRLPRALLAELEHLGQPPANSQAWRVVLKARQAILGTEIRQIKAALADDASAFVRTLYQQASDYNQLVFISAVFGVQSCTFS